MTHAADIEAHPAQVVDQAQHIEIVGDAKVCPYLVFLDVSRVDAEDDFCLVLKALQELLLFPFTSNPGSTREAW